MAGTVSTLSEDFAVFYQLPPQAPQAPSTSTALQQLNVSMQQAGFPVASDGTLEPQWLGGLWNWTKKHLPDIIAVGGAVVKNLSADSTDVEMQFFGGWLRSEVADLIAKLHGYVNKYSQLADCVPLVQETVDLFADEAYVKALYKGYEAFNCIRSKLD